ncbi:MAG: hypothetical protein WB509_02340 [Acetobacteraceae bacterium]
MIHPAMRVLRRPFAVATLSVGLSTLAGLVHAAMARVWVRFGFPLFVGPPAYYTPPYRPTGQSCVAGSAVCPMDHLVASGSGCYCTTTHGRLWGGAT